MLNISLPKSDAIGAMSSSLCMIHCIATPFFFFAATGTASCCSATPEWWQWLDYMFLFISFFAVRQSTKNTDYKLIKYGLWISWIGLFILVFNVKFQWFFISENSKFIPAFSLVGLHLYNLRYCKCEDKECC